MACKPTYQGQRFSDLNKIKDFIKTQNVATSNKYMAKLLSPDDQKNIATVLEIRSVNSAALLQKYDPSALLEVVSHFSRLFSEKVDELHSRMVTIAKQKGFQIPERSKVFKQKGADVRGIFTIIVRNAMKDTVGFLQKTELTIEEEHYKRNLLSLFGINIADTATQQGLLEGLSVLDSMKDSMTPEAYLQGYWTTVFTYLGSPDSILNDQTSTLSSILFLSTFELVSTENLELTTGLKALNRQVNDEAYINLVKHFDDYVINNGEDIDENTQDGDPEATTREGWQVDKDSESSYSNLPDTLRNLFSTINALRVNQEGKLVPYHNMFGRKVKLDAPHVYATLTNALVGVPTEKDMMKVIESMSSYYWTSSLYNTLKNDPVLRTQFFNNMRRNKQPFTKLLISTSIEGNVGLYVADVNKDKSIDTFTSKTLSNIQTNSLVGGFTTFYDKDGNITEDTLKNTLGWYNTITKSSNITSINDVETREDTRDYLNQFLIPALNNLGITIDNYVLNDFNTQIDSGNFKKNKAALLSLESELAFTYTKLGKIKTSLSPNGREKYKNKENKKRNATTYVIENWVGDSNETHLTNIIKKLLPITNQVQLEQYVRAGKKSFYSNTYPSALGDFISRLNYYSDEHKNSSVKSNTRRTKVESNTRWTNFLNNEWLSSKFFKKNVDEIPDYIRNKGIYIRWLQDIVESEGNTNIDWSRNLSLNDPSNTFIKDKEYSKWNENDHLVTMFMHYFSEASYGRANKCLIPLFVTGDTDALRFLKVNSYNNTSIMNGLFDFFYQEVWKIDTLLPEMKKSGINIKNFNKELVGSDFKTQFMNYNFQTMPFINDTDTKEQLCNLVLLKKNNQTNNNFAINTQIKELLFEKLLEQADSFYSNNSELLLQKTYSKKDQYTYIMDTTPVVMVEKVFNNIPFIIDRFNLNNNNGVIDFYVDETKFKNEDIDSDIDIDIDNTDKNKNKKKSSSTAKLPRRPTIFDSNAILKEKIKPNQLQNSYFKSGDVYISLYDIIAQYMVYDYYLNHYFGTLNQIALFGIDSAMYDGPKGLQKRYKQTVASGDALNIDAVDVYNSTPDEVRYYIPRDINGNPVKRKLIYMKDVRKTINKNLVNNLDRIIPKSEDKTTLIKKLRDPKTDASITDGAAYITSTEYRRIEGTRGRLSPAKNKLIKDVQAGKKVVATKETSMNPLKPYYFGKEHIKLSDGTTFINAIQQKSSEVVLDSRSLKENSKKQWMAKFMEEYDVVIVSEEAIKVGLHSVIDFDIDGEEGKFASYEDYKDFLNKQIEANPHSIHEVPYDDYKIQNNVPYSMYKHANLGTQLRKLVLSGLDMVKNYTYGKYNIVDKEGKFIRKQNLNVTGKKMDRIFQSLLTENHIYHAQKLQDSFDTPLGLYAAIADELIVNKNYSKDLLDAFVTGEDGVPVLSTSDPAVHSQIEQILMSKVQKEIVGLKVVGGSAVRATNIGETVSFRDKDDVKQTRNLGFKIEGDKIYMECIMPMYNKSLFIPYMDEAGEVDMEAAGKAGLLDVIGYRIPTEQSFSMWSMKIVGFSDPALGGTIQLPTEATAFLGDDFDIDKLYLMFRNFEVIVKDGVLDRTEQIMFKASGDILDAIPENSQEARDNLMFDIIYDRLVDPEIYINKFTPGNFDEAKDAAKLIKFFTQQSLKDIKKIGSIGTTYNDFNILSNILDNEEYKNTKSDSMEILLDYADPATHIEYSMKNKIASVAIAVFADHSVNRALSEVMGKQSASTPLVLHEFGPSIINKKIIKRPKRKSSAILQTVEVDTSIPSQQSVTASVDAVKEPSLGFLNLEGPTFNHFALLGRYGYTVLEIGLFTAQPILSKLVKDIRLSSSSEENTIKEWKKYYKITQKDIQSANHVTTADMVESFLLHKEFSEVGPDDFGMMKTDRMFTLDRQMFLAYLQLRPAANNLASFVKISKNASRTKNTNTYGGVFQRVLNFEKYFKNLYGSENPPIQYTESPLESGLKWKSDPFAIDSFHELRTALKNVPFMYEQAIYEITAKNISKLFDNKLKLLDDDILSIFRNISENLSKNINKEFINETLSDLVMYFITNSPIFAFENINQTFWAIRDYLEKSPVLEKFPIVNVLKVDRKGTQFVMSGEAKWSQPDKQIITASWASLYLLKIRQYHKYKNSLPEGTEALSIEEFKATDKVTMYIKNPYSKEISEVTLKPEDIDNAYDLAMDLAIHGLSFMGFQFGPTNFTWLMPTTVKMGIPEYMNQLKLFEGTDFNNFQNSVNEETISFYRNFIHHIFTKHAGDSNITPNVTLKKFDPNIKGENHVIITKHSFQFTIDPTQVDKDSDVFEVPENLIIEEYPVDGTAKFAPAFVSNNKDVYFAEPFTIDVNNAIIGTTIKYVRVAEAMDNKNDYYIDANAKVIADNDGSYLSTTTYRENYLERIGKYESILDKFNKGIANLKKLGIINKKSSWKGRDISTRIVQSTYINENGQIDKEKWNNTAYKIINELDSQGLTFGVDYNFHEVNNSYITFKEVYFSINKPKKPIDVNNFQLTIQPNYADKERISRSGIIKNHGIDVANYFINKNGKLIINHLNDSKNEDLITAINTLAVAVKLSWKKITGELPIIKTPEEVLSDYALNYQDDKEAEYPVQSEESFVDTLVNEFNSLVGFNNEVALDQYIMATDLISEISKKIDKDSFRDSSGNPIC